MSSTRNTPGSKVRGRRCRDLGAGIPTEKSEAEILIGIHLEELGLTPFVRELQFHEKRKWKFDAAVPHLKIGIEIEGGIHQFRNPRTNELIVGRHSRGAGYQEDLDKYNAAAARGWIVFRFSVEDVRFARSKEALAAWQRFQKVKA